jgi:HSP20 family protein
MGGVFPYNKVMPHTRHRTWIEIQKKHAGFHHPAMRGDLDAEWIPNADVIESADGLVVRLEVAAVEQDTIQIMATGSALVISGRRVNPNTGGTAAGFRFRQMEIEYGPFERVLPLPFPVQQNEVHAHFRQGLLEINLPRARSATGKKMVIPIQW